MFSPTTPPDKKPILSSPSSSADNKINVLVRAQAGGELIFKVKLSTQFSKIASAFCKARGVDVKTVRFLSDRGQRLMGQTTIEELELDVEEDEDGFPTIYVDALSEQIGG